MRTKFISLLFAVVASPGYGFGQSPGKPLTQAEILGRLAVGYSPSYVARLVKTRTIRFSPTEHFLSAVGAAGGEGILVARLSSTEASAAAQAFDEGSRSSEELARCAALLRSGATEDAESECRAATEENPQSRWPWLATLRALELRGATTEERNALLDLCDRKAPDLARSKGGSSMTNLFAGGREEQTMNGSAEEGNSSDDVEGRIYSSENEAEYRDQPDLEPLSPEVETQIRSEIKKLSEQGSDLARNRIFAAHLYRRLGETALEKGELKEAGRLEPGNAGIHYALGQFYRTQQEVENEIAEFREAVRLAPYGAVEHQALADTLVREGREEEAISEWRSLVRLSPQNLRASNALVQLYMKQSDRKAAIAELRRSLKVSFAARDEEGYANKRYADVVYLAQLLTEDRDFEGAAELYEFQLRFHPASASLHYGYGNVLFRMRRLAEASREYRAVLEEQPELSLVHRNLGICLATEKDTDGAIAEYRQAQETEPDDRAIRILLGDALLQKGELNGAMEQYQEAIRRNPGEAAARVHLAHAFFLNHDAASAVDELERALELKPDFPEAENELGRIYATSTDPHFRNPATALSAARRAVESSGEPAPEFLDTLAEALLVNGQPLEALKVEEQAAQLAGANDEIQNRLERFRQAAVSASANTP